MEDKEKKSVSDLIKELVDKVIAEISIHNDSDIKQDDLSVKQGWQDKINDYKEED